MTYRPKGEKSLGRPLKRWRETVTGHCEEEEQEVVKLQNTATFFHKYCYQ
jgi:hypothetical protein